MNEANVSTINSWLQKEAEALDEQFFEFSCGPKSDMAQVLAYRLELIAKQYNKVRAEYDRQSILTVANIYGFCDDEDTANTCRENLFEIWHTAYIRRCGKNAAGYLQNAVRYMLDNNVLYIKDMEVGFNAYKEDDGTFTSTFTSISRGTGDRIIVPAWKLVGQGLKRYDLDLSDILMDQEDSDFVPSEEDKDMKPGESYSTSYVGMPCFSFSLDAIETFAFREYYHIFHLRYLKIENAGY